ncbi:MAG: DUF4340 domain-containing protein [Pseudomonadales bacterium]
MNLRLPLLAGLLALQALVVAVLLLVNSGTGNQAAPELLDVDLENVDEVAISDGDGNSVTLHRAENGWQLDDGTPADAAKLNEVLEDLKSQAAAWPVATSDSARTRFEVDESSFQRHLVLSHEGKPLAELYLGTSPGYRRVNARNAAAAEIYSIDFANYRLPAKADDWLDKGLLKARGVVTAITLAHDGGGWSLQRGEEGWLLDGGAAGQDAAADAARRVAELLVMGRAEAPGEGVEPTARLTVTDDDGDYHLTLYHAAEGDEYLISSDRVQGYFRLAAYVAEQLLVDAQTLQASDDASGGSADAAGTETGAADGVDSGTP